MKPGFARSYPMIWDEIVRLKSFAATEPTAYTTIKLIREKPDLSFFDITVNRQLKKKLQLM